MSTAESPLDSAEPAVSASDVPDDPYAVLGNRDFRLYLIGRFIASIGQQMLTVAVGWELYERTGSALALGMVGLANVVPMFLFTLPAGHLADNFNRKKIIVAMTGVIGLASAGLAVASATAAPTYWIYACLFATAGARTFLWPASSSFLPLLVSRQAFPRAVAWSTGSFQLSSVAGPAVGGALIALTHQAAPVYAMNALAMAVCLTLVSLVRYHRTATSR